LGRAYAGFGLTWPAIDRDLSGRVQVGVEVVDIARAKSQLRERMTNGRMMVCRIQITRWIARVANESPAAIPHQLPRRDQSGREEHQHRPHGQHRSRPSGRAVDDRWAAFADEATELRL